MCALDAKVVRYIDDMSEESLQLARSLITERLKGIWKIKRTNELSRFKKGDLVQFYDRQGNPIRAVVQRVNAKTLTGRQKGGDRDGFKWRIGNLSKVVKVMS